MRLSKTKTLLLTLATIAAATATLAQWGQWGRRGRDYEERAGVPMWENDPDFKNDVFTFVRVEYDSVWGGGGRRWRGGGGGWRTDFPDSDYNFSYRLQQLTSLKVNPNPVILRLTDKELFDYPFIYMIEPGALLFSEQEVAALRRYLLNGGFLMVDDFWGDAEWENFYEQIKRVFPDREPQELPLEHEIFHCVFNLKAKPQVPNVRAAIAGREQGITWETNHVGDSKTIHYRAFFDDKGRMMAIICHNTDLGDGWEEEGTDQWFFHEFAENKAYPMGINIVTYAMTH